MSNAVNDQWNVISYDRRFRIESSSPRRLHDVLEGADVKGNGRVRPTDADCDVAVVWASGTLDDSRAQPTWGRAALRLGSRLPLSESESLSGITRIAHPFLGEGSNEQEQTLERFLADQMNLIIASVDQEHNLPTRHLIHGPLLRKLRGRLAYELYDPRRRTTLALDWDDRRIHRICPTSGAWEPRWSLIGSRNSFCYGPYPSLTLDAGVRYYELVIGRWRYLVEAPLCALPLAKAMEYFIGLVPSLLAEVAISLEGAIKANLARGDDSYESPLPALFEVARRKAEELVQVRETSARSARVEVSVPDAKAALGEGGRRRLRSVVTNRNVMGVLTKYRIAGGDRLAITSYVREWVTDVNTLDMASPGFAHAVVNELANLDPPLALVAAQPKNLQWVKKQLGDISAAARLRCNDVD
jgi:hypothetical protein